VDGIGNVYITLNWNSTVLKETLLAGNYIQSTLPTGSSSPYGVAVDGSGNVYIADTYNQQVLKEDFADAPSRSFAGTAPGSTSSDSPQTVTLENIGNAALHFPVPGSGNNPSVAANFTLNSTGASVCPVVSGGSSTAGTLFAGHSCLLPISFTPTAAGAVSGTLAITDNALNASAPAFTTQSIQLNGTGTVADTMQQNSGPPPACPSSWTPTITKISPNTWFAGKTYHITIKGANFYKGYRCTPRVGQGTIGAVTTLQIATTGSRAQLVPIPEFEVVDQTTIKATVTPEANTPTVAANVTVCVYSSYLDGPIQPAGGRLKAANANAIPFPCIYTPSSPGEIAQIATQPAQILATPQIQCGSGMPCNGQTISGDNPPVQSAVVGQKINLVTAPTADTLSKLFIPVTLLPNTPQGPLPNSPGKWTVDGTNIGGYNPTTESSEDAITETVTTQTSLTTYWVYASVAGTPFQIKYKYCVDIPGLSTLDDANNKCSLEATAKFNISGGGTMKATPYQAKHPDKAMTIDSLVPCVDGAPLKGGTSEPRLAYGNIAGYSCSAFPSSSFGITFRPSGAPSDGIYSYVQLINSDTRTMNTISCTTSQGVDLAYPYKGIVPGTNPPQAEDAPNAPLPTGYVVNRSFNATMFLMWTSNLAESIAVPIGYQTWGFSGTAQQNAKGKWVATANGTPGLAGGFVTSDGSQTTDGYSVLKYGYPTWNGPAKETCN
jgi:hypothetical protein